MVIAFRVFSDIPVKTRTRRYIHFASDNRLDAFGFTGFIKINDTVHDAVIRDRGRVHAQFLHMPDIFRNFIGAIQK